MDSDQGMSPVHRLDPSSSLTFPRRGKLNDTAHKHEQIKMSYRELKSQIHTGLIQVEEVFTSLAIPLMKLVGLKAAEMGDGRRFNTIFIDSNQNNEDLNQNKKIHDINTGRETSERINAPEGESFTVRARAASTRLVEQQQKQSFQLVHLLQKMKIQITTLHDDIINILHNHRFSLQKFCQKTVCFISALSQNRDIFIVTLELLQTVFDNIIAVIGFVEDDIKRVMQEMAEQVLVPLTDFVKELKAEIRNGACIGLMAMSEEMDHVLRVQRMESDYLVSKLKMEEKMKNEALSKLREAEERIVQMEDRLRLSSENKKEFVESLFPHKFVDMEEEGKEDSLLWELLRKKRRYQPPQTPVGHHNCKSPKTRSTVSHRPVTRSCTRGRHVQLCSTA